MTASLLRFLFIVRRGVAFLTIQQHFIICRWPTKKCNLPSSYKGGIYGCSLGHLSGVHLVPNVLYFDCNPIIVWLSFNCVSSGLSPELFPYILKSSFVTPKKYFECKSSHEISEFLPAQNTGLSVCSTLVILFHVGIKAACFHYTHFWSAACGLHKLHPKVYSVPKVMVFRAARLLQGFGLPSPAHNTFTHVASSSHECFIIA